DGHVTGVQTCAVPISLILNELHKKVSRHELLVERRRFGGPAIEAAALDQELVPADLLVQFVENESRLLAPLRLGLRNRLDLLVQDRKSVVQGKSVECW